MANEHKQEDQNLSFYLNTKYFNYVESVGNGCPNLPSQRLMFKRSTNSRSNWNLEILVFEEGGKPEYPEKNRRSKDEHLSVARKLVTRCKLFLSASVNALPYWDQEKLLSKVFHMERILIDKHRQDKSITSFGEN